MKVKRTELVNLKNVLNTMGGVAGDKLVYAIVKNKRLIKQILKKTEEILDEEKGYQEYEKVRIQLCEKHCIKDKNNKSMIVNKTYVGLKDHKIFKKELDLLNKKHEKDLKIRRAQIVDYNQTMIEEVEIKLHQVKESDCKGLTVRQYEGIVLIIDEK